MTTVWTTIGAFCEENLCRFNVLHHTKEDCIRNDNTHRSRPIVLVFNIASVSLSAGHCQQIANYAIHLVDSSLCSVQAHMVVCVVGTAKKGQIVATISDEQEPVPRNCRTDLIITV